MGSEGKIEVERPATWKVVTVGAALTGLSVTGAGAAQADNGATVPAPASVSAADLNAPLRPHGTPHWSPWRPHWTPWKVVNSPWKCVDSPWKCVPPW